MEAWMNFYRSMPRFDIGGRGGLPEVSKQWHARTRKHYMGDFQMSISRRSLLKRGLAVGAFLGLRLQTALAQEPKPAIAVFKSPS